MITSTKHLKPINRIKTPEKSNKIMNPSFPYLEIASKSTLMLSSEHNNSRNRLES